MLLRIDNPSLEGAEQTVLTDSVNTGASNLQVKSSQGLTALDYGVIGPYGVEKTELKQLSTITDTLNIAPASLAYSHSEGDPLTLIRWNQIKIYKATSLTGTYSILTTVGIDVDQTTTNYDDTTGLSTDYYKISYYNSQTTVESSLSDPIPGGGIDTNTVRYVTDQILKEAKDPNEDFTDRDEILDWFNDCSADIKARRRKWAFLLTRAVGSRIINQEYYDITTAFGVTDIDKISHLDYNLNDGVSDINYRLRYVMPEEFDSITTDNDEDGNDSIQRWTWDEARDYIRVYPKPATSGNTCFYLYYYKDIPMLDSDGDSFLVSPRVYKYYALSQFHTKKGDINIADRYSMKYEQALVGLVRDQRKEVGQPRGFSFNPKGIRRYYRY